MFEAHGESSRPRESDSDSESDDGTACKTYPAFYMPPEPAQAETSTSTGENPQQVAPGLSVADLIRATQLTHFEESRIILMDVSRRALYNKIPHSWLGNGLLLRLMEPAHSGNYVLFQKVWKREFPLIVSNVSKKLNIHLWNPSSISQGYGDERNDFMNCLAGETILDQPMQVFWDGFENPSRRPRTGEGIPMLLRMKAWPRCLSFQELLPFHMNDLFENLPLPTYTRPNGLLNFINFLPTGFLSQDLGTELECAYGSTDYPSVGTKKLDINVADLAYILVYIGKLKNRERNNDDEQNRVLQAIQEAGCDNASLDRVRRNGEIPGAIWHVYNVLDIRKINKFLDKVAFERGIVPRPDQEPVQGETWYLDNTLRERLRREYKVESHAILQCLGDAVVIPAGAPHQVRNLKSCITIKHEFMSLQNIKKF